MYMYIMPSHLSTSSLALPRLNSKLPQSPVWNSQQPCTDHQKEIKKVATVLHLYELFDFAVRLWLFSYFILNLFKKSENFEESLNY